MKLLIIDGAGYAGIPRKVITVAGKKYKSANHCDLDRIVTAIIEYYYD